MKSRTGKYGGGKGGGILEREKKKTWGRKIRRNVKKKIGKE